jgi:hypothetical protein
MPNVVEIIVRTKDETNFDEIRRNAATLGDDASKAFEDRFADRLVTLRTRIRESIRRAGSDIGDELGDHIGRRASERIKEHVSRAGGGQPRDERGRFTSGARSGGIPDDDDKSFLSRMGMLGEKAGDKLSEGIGGSLQTFFSGDFVTLLLKGLAVAVLGAGISVILSGAIASAVLLALGTGVIGLGVAASLKDPRIKAAAGDLKTQFGELFEEFGKPFRTPVAEFLERLSRDILPTLRTYGPVIAAIFAPLADKLGDGLIGFIQNLLPGLVDGLKGAEPIIEVLADRLPDIGQALGDFFRELGEHGDEASVFFNDLITVVLKLIDWFGKFIGLNLELYVAIRNVFVNGKQLVLDFAMAAIDWFERLVDSAVAAFGWIPGLSGKLAGAKAAFADARKGINAELAKIKDKTVTIRVRTFGIATARAALGVAERLADLQGNAHGGIVGAAVGGVHSGLRWVGEQGPELAKLPAGTTVHSAADSQRMWRGMGGGGGGSTEVLLSAKPSANRDLISALIESLQYECRTRYEGKAQKMLGAAGVPA